MVNPRRRRSQWARLQMGQRCSTLMGSKSNSKLKLGLREALLWKVFRLLTFLKRIKLHFSQHQALNNYSSGKFTQYVNPLRQSASSTTSHSFTTSHPNATACCSSPTVNSQPVPHSVPGTTTTPFKCGHSNTLTTAESTGIYNCRRCTIAQAAGACLHIKWCLGGVG